MKKILIFLCACVLTKMSFGEIVRHLYNNQTKNYYSIDFGEDNPMVNIASVNHPELCKGNSCMIVPGNNDVFVLTSSGSGLFNPVVKVTLIPIGRPPGDYSATINLKFDVPRIDEDLTTEFDTSTINDPYDIFNKNNYPNIYNGVEFEWNNDTEGDLTIADYH